jgi:hypothetical protein
MLIVHNTMILVLKINFHVSFFLFFFWRGVVRVAILWVTGNPFQLFKGILLFAVVL